MARKSISWILDFTSKLPNKEEKLKCLRANNVPAITTILKYCYDPKIKWALPEGAPPYTPNPEKYLEEELYSDIRRLYLFLAPESGGNPDLKPLRRESMFIDLLQRVDPDDALLLLSIKDKKLPYKGLTSKLVQEAFPGIY